MKDLLIIFVVLLILLIIISTLGGSVRHLAPTPYVYPSTPYDSMDKKSVEKYSEKRNIHKKSEGDDDPDAISGSSDMRAFAGDDGGDEHVDAEMEQEKDADTTKAPVIEDEEDAEVDAVGGGGATKNDTQGKEDGVEGFEEGTYAPF